MKVVHVPDSLPAHHAFRPVRNSIFLAGPTPRSGAVRSWRPEALQILDGLGHTGYVFVPETAGWGWSGDYDAQVLWEWQALGRAASVVFWVPRDLETMPAFTTNVEFGMIVSMFPGRAVLGFPVGCPKMRYLESLARRQDEFSRAMSTSSDARDYDPAPIPVVHTLREALEHAMDTAS
ncbi:MAG: nucleoside 2-deoxyribosyltransferase domain-containing protein [Nitrospira sp.]